jgi:dihydroorotase
MANTDPVADTAGVVEQVWRLGREAGYCDVRPVGAVTVGLKGERLAEIGAMADSAAQVRVFSDDGHCVSDAALMRRALEYVKAFGGVIAQHAQEPRLTEGAQMNEGELSGLLGLQGWPAVAEEAIIARDVLLAAHTGSRLHVCHLSTAGSVELVRWAKSKGYPVTAEVTPHHLSMWLPFEQEPDPPALRKVNPPLRTEADRRALVEALREGVIDAVATDHAPHPAEDKVGDYADTAPGMIGLETALATCLTLGGMGGDWLPVLVERLTAGPWRVLGAAAGLREPRLRIGQPCSFVLFDPEREWVVGAEPLHSRSGNTPLLGVPLRGRVLLTVAEGVLVHLSSTFEVPGLSAVPGG